MAGNVWYLKQEYDKAIADFYEVVRLDPATQRLRTACHRPVDKEDYDKALADFDEAVRLDPNDANAQTWQSVIWNAKEDYDKALADYSEAIRIDPSTGRLFPTRHRLVQQEEKTRPSPTTERRSGSIRTTPGAPPSHRYGPRRPTPIFRDGESAVESASRSSELETGASPAPSASSPPPSPAGDRRRRKAPGRGDHRAPGRRPEQVAYKAYLDLFHGKPYHQSP